MYVSLSFLVFLMTQLVMVENFNNLHTCLVYVKSMYPEHEEKNLGVYLNSSSTVIIE